MTAASNRAPAKISALVARGDGLRMPAKCLCHELPRAMRIVLMLCTTNADRGSTVPPRFKYEPALSSRRGFTFPRWNFCAAMAVGAGAVREQVAATARGEQLRVLPDSTDRYCRCLTASPNCRRLSAARRLLPLRCVRCC